MVGNKPLSNKAFKLVQKTQTTVLTLAVDVPSDDN